MVIQNKATGAKYPTTKTKWNEMPAKAQKLFKIIDPNDEDGESAGNEQQVQNKAPKREREHRPATGERDNNTQNTRKSTRTKK